MWGGPSRQTSFSHSRKHNGGRKPCTLGSIWEGFGELYLARNGEACFQGRRTPKPKGQGLPSLISYHSSTRAARPGKEGARRKEFRIETKTGKRSSVLKLAIRVAATQGLPFPPQPPQTGRQSSFSAPLPAKERPRPLSRLGNRRAGSRRVAPPPRLRGGAATTTTGWPGWRPMEPAPRRNSPLQLLRPGPGPKGRGMRGAASLPG